MVDEVSINHMVMLISNWISNLVFCTNGEHELTEEQEELLESKGFKYNEAVISEMTGSNGQVESLKFEDGTVENIQGMIAKMNWDTNYDFLKNLELKRRDDKGIEVEQFGETSVPGLFVAGETKTNFAGQLINAAADSADVAKFMIMKQLQEEF